MQPLKQYIIEMILTQCN